MALIDTLTTFARRFRRLSSEAGASLVEYTLLVALVAVAAIVGMQFIGNAANDQLCDVGDKVASDSYTGDTCTSTTAVTP